jgi:acyl-CoA thioesterase-1
MKFSGRIFILVVGLAWLNIAQAEIIHIVCFGGSNTYGKNLARADAYPARLEAMLKAKGYDVTVKNEGTNGQTTSDELAKLNSAVPEGTAIVIFQPGGNDARPSRKPGGGGGNTEENIRAIVQNLRDRKIEVIFSGNKAKQKYVEQFDLLRIGEIASLAPDDFQSDREHLTPQGYRIVAEKLLPLVEKVIQKIQPR